MRLSPIQRSYLRFLTTFKNEELTLRGIIWFNRYLYVRLVLALALPVILLLSIGKSWMVLPLATFLAGAFFRDLGFYRNNLRLWPIVKQIVDWSAVERLQQADEFTSPKRTDP